MKALRQNEIRTLLEQRSSATDLQEYLDANPKLGHLSVSQRGKSITIASGSREDRDPRARFTHLAGGQWQLSFPTWNGSKWERTPFIGTVRDLFETVLDAFPDRFTP